MTVVHLTASTFFGGPERQMLGLARQLPERTLFLAFSEGGRCGEFLEQIHAQGFDGLALKNDTPHFRAAIGEIASLLFKHRAGLLLCHGYKANLLGRLAAHRLGLPAIAVSRGWTGESRKVRLYERLDRWHLKRMDHVIAVSDGQAKKVLACGVDPAKLTVIRNAARLDAFQVADAADGAALNAMLPGPGKLVIAAGRLSPEKGFDILIEAMSAVDDARCILFGEGPERSKLEAMIESRKMKERFLLAGHTTKLDRYLPHADLMVLPSYTEGLPNVLLEASAAGVAIAATAVGGTPEVVAHGTTGLLVEPGNAAALGNAIRTLLDNDNMRKKFGDAGRKRMIDHFTFEAQAKHYRALLQQFQSEARMAA
jgi:glycosyltransferase involved in cell wall biosynthesis